MHRLLPLLFFLLIMPGFLLAQADHMVVTTQPAETTAGQMVEGTPGVEVQDAFNAPVGAGVEVTVTINKNSFSGSTVSVNTDANGIATFDNLVVETADTDYQLTFSSSGLTDVTSNVFDVIPAAPDYMSIITQPKDTLQGKVIPGHPTIGLFDVFDNPVEAVDITATINKNSFSGGTTTVLTNSEGNAIFDDLVLNAFDTNYSITFDADDVDAPNADNVVSGFFEIFEERATITVSNQPVNSVQAGKVEGADVINPPSVLVEDMGNTPLDATTVTVSLLNGDFAAGSNLTAQTNASGIAEFDNLIIDDLNPNYQLVFSVSDYVANATSDAFEIEAGSGILSISQEPLESVEGYQVQGAPAVYLEDSGSPLNNVDVTAWLNKNDFAVGSQITVSTGANGIAVFDDLVIDDIGTGYQIFFKADQGGVATISTGNFDVAEEVAILSMENQPEITIEGETVNGPPSVKVTDAVTGDPVYPINVYASFPDGSFSGESTVMAPTDVNGIATFDNLVIDIPGNNYELVFSTQSTGIADVNSAAFNVIEIAGNITIAPQPSESVEGHPVSGNPSVTIMEPDGTTPMGGIEVTAVLNKNDFNNAESTVQIITDVNGVAVFDNLVIDDVDAGYNISFNVDVNTGVANQTSDNFDVESEIGEIAIDQQPLLTIEGELINGHPAVVVTDTDGNPLPSTNVDVALNKNSFTAGSTTQVTTGNSGVAVFDNLIVDNVADDYALTFSVGSGFAEISSSSFNVIDVYGEMTISSQPRESVGGYAVEGLPQVTVLDNLSNPVAGLDVTAVINQNNFTVASTLTVTTDAQGIAAFDNLILDQTGSDYEITFSVDVASGIPNKVSAPFDVVSEVAVIEFVQQPERTIEGESINGVPAVSLKTTGGTPIEGGNISAIINKSDFTAGSTTTVSTNASGIAVFDNLVLDNADTGYQIVFSTGSSGVASKTSSVFEVVEPVGIMTISQQPMETIDGEVVAGPPAVSLTENDSSPWTGSEVTITASTNKNGFSSGTSSKLTVGGEVVFDDLIMNAIDNDYQLDFSIDIADAYIVGKSSDPFDVVALSGNLNVTLQPSEAVNGDLINGPPTVRLSNLSGNPVPDVDVSVSLNKNDFAGSSITTVTTNSDGEAIFNNLVIDDIADDYAITFSADGVSGVADVTSGFFNITEENYSMVVSAQPQETVAGQSLVGSPAVTITNGGSGVDNISVTASINKNAFEGSSTLTATTDVNGIATFNNLVLNAAADDYVILFNAAQSGVPNVQSATFAVANAGADYIEVSSQPSTADAGDNIAGSPSATVFDAFGNTVSGVDVTVEPNDHQGTFAGTTTVTTNASGVAIFDDIVQTIADTGYKLFFTAPGATTGNSDLFDINNASPDNISIITQPSETTTGAAISGPPLVRVVDQYGNPVQGETVTVSEEGGYAMDGGELQVVTNIDGEAVFTDLVINTEALGYRLKFEVSGLEVVSNLFDVIQGNVFGRFFGGTHSGLISFSWQNILLGQTPSRIEIASQPQETVVGSEVAGQTRVVVYDNSDNTIPNVSVTVTGAAFASGQETLSTDENGEIIFEDLVIDAIGAYQLTFTADDYSGVSAQSQSFDVINALATMEMDVQPVNTVAGSIIGGHPAVSLKNSLGMPMEGIDVSVYLNQFSFSNGTYTVTTDENGIALFDDLVIDRAADDFRMIFDAGYQGVQNIYSGFFDISNASAHEIRLNSQPQETEEGATITGSPSVVVYDEYGNTVSGVNVTVAEELAGTIDAGITEIATNSNGIAEFSTLVVNNIGTYQFSFSASGVPDVTSNTFRVISGTVANRFRGNGYSGFISRLTENKTLGQTPARIEVVTQPLETVSGFEIEGLPVIRVYDEADEPVANVQVTVSALGGGHLNGTTTRTTDDSGEIVFNNLVLDDTGSYQLSFTADNHTATVDDVESAFFNVVDQVYTMNIKVQPENTIAGQPVEGVPTVSVTNFINQPVEGVDVRVYINQNNFAAGTTTVTTDEFGDAVFDDLEINIATGNYQLIFDADYSGISNVTSNVFDITNALASEILIGNHPYGTIEGAAIEGNPLVAVVDAFGNAVEGEVVTVAETGGYAFDAGTISQTTDESGEASFNDLIINAIGQYSLTFTADGVAAASTQVFNVVSGTLSNRFLGSSHSGFAKNSIDQKSLGQTPTRLEITSEPQETVSGIEIEGPPQIVVYDETDKVIADVSVTVSLDGGNFSSGEMTRTTDGNGTVVFDGLVVDVINNYRLDFVVDGYPSVSASSSIFEVVDQQLFMSVDTQPALTVAGGYVAGPPQVRVENLAGQGFGGVNVSVYLNQNSFASDPVKHTVTTDVDGYAQFDELQINEVAQGYRLIFDADYSGVVNEFSDAFNVISGGAHEISLVTQPADTESGAAVVGAPAVRVIDDLGNPVSGVDVTVAESGGSSFSSGTLVQTSDEFGMVVFDDLIIEETNQYSLVFSAAGVSDVTSGTFNILSGTLGNRYFGSSHSGFTLHDVQNTALGQTPTRIDILSQPLETITDDLIEGVPTVVVYDEMDKPMGGVTISATVNGFFAGGSTTELITDSNGEAVFDNLTISEVGTYELTFEDQGFAGLSVISQSFDVVSPTLTMEMHQQPLESVAGQNIAGPAAVKLANLYGQGFEGVEVTAYLNQYNFASEVSTFTTTTNSSGIAQFDELVIEKAAENYQIIFEADYSGVNNITSDGFEVVHADAEKFVFVSQPTGSIAEGIIEGMPSVALYDLYNNPVGGVDITVSEAGAYPLDAGTFVKASDEDGYAVFDDLVINAAGAFSLNFSADAVGVIDIQSDGFDVLPGNVADRFKGSEASGFVTKEEQDVLLQQIPAQLVLISQPGQSVEGFEIEGPPTLKVLDSNDNLIGGVAVTASVVGGGMTLGGTVTKETDLYGEVVFDDLNIDQTGSYSLRFEVTGYTGVDVYTITQDFEVILPSLSMEIEQQPVNSEAGAVLGGFPEVRITNHVNQGVEGVDITVYLNQNDFASGAENHTVTTGIDGTAVFDELVIELAATNYQLIFDADYSGISNVSSGVFVVTPAAANYMAVTSEPLITDEGATISGPPAVAIFDVYNNPVPGTTINVAESQEGYALSGSTGIATDENGEALFDDLIINDPGFYQLVFDAAAAGVDDVQSVLFNVADAETGNRYLGSSHSGFTSSIITEQLLSEPPSVESPVFTQPDPLEPYCQGNAGIDFTATAMHSDSVRYSLSIGGAGTIDEETGVVDLASGFYGVFDVVATAYGYNGPTVSSVEVEVLAEIDAPVFNEPVEEVCQGALPTIYSAESVHTTTISYSVAPAEAGSIDESTGEMTWDAGFSGTASITATAGEVGDCGGQKSTTVEVDVLQEVGQPVFTEGANELCQNSLNETYTATATNATNIVYSRNPSEAGTINTSTGEMNWNADFHGTVTITARAEGVCGGPKDTDLEVTIRPTPVTGEISGNISPACNANGEAYSVALTGGSDYSWSVPAGAVIASGENGPENNAITVDFSETNGFVRVVETTVYGCVGAEEELQVTMHGCNLAANFEASETDTYEGNTVTFTDLSTGNVDAWDWDFGAGATPQTATGAGPHDVVYSSEGTYSVSLTVHEQTVQDTKTINDYITIRKQGTWLGTESTNWFDPANWASGSVPVSNTGVYISETPVGGVFPVINGDAFCKILSLENSSSITLRPGATLDISNDLTNNGKIIFEADFGKAPAAMIPPIDNTDAGEGEFYINNLPGNAWVKLGHPVKSPKASIYKVGGTEEVDSWIYRVFNGWQQITDPNLDIKEMGGINAWYAPKDASDTYDLHYNGTINTGQSIYEVEGGGYYLLGNPFTSAIDWQNEDGNGWDRTSNVGPTMWQRVHVGVGVSDYEFAYNRGTGVPQVIPTEYGFTDENVSHIAPFQSVWIYVSDKAPAHVQVDNKARVRSDLPLKRASSETKSYDIIRVKTKRTNQFLDGTVLYFDETFDSGIDYSDSEKKLNSTEGYPEVFTKAAGKRLGINGMPALGEEHYAFPLVVRNRVEGEVSMRFTLDKFNARYEVFLEDREKGIWTNVKIFSEYHYSPTELGMNEDRFVIHLQKVKEVPTNIDEQLQNENVGGIEISGFDDYAHVNISDALLQSTQATIELLDASGRLILSRKTASTETEIPLPEQNGVYIVRVKAGSAVKTGKVVKR